MKLVLLLIPSFFIFVSTQQCKNVAYSVPGRYLKGHVISNPNVKDIGQCLVACSQNQRCQSINFRFLGLVCELNDADRQTHPWDYELKDGYAYSDYPIKAAFNRVEYHVTPFWLKAHAPYIDSTHAITANQITFNAGSLEKAALLKLPLVAAGVLSDKTLLTIEITVANDVSIGGSVDSDPFYGLSDGTNFIGFQTVDRKNYISYAPCYGSEGISGQSLSGIRNIDKNVPLTNDEFYPEQFIFTIKLDKLWGSCFTAHDGAFNKTAGYSKRLKPSNGLSLEVYKMQQRESVGIKYIKVTIMRTGD